MAGKARTKGGNNRASASTASALYNKAHAEMQNAKPELLKVASMLHRAAARGDAKSSYALATWYLHGKEPYIQRNLHQAIRLLRHAVEANLPDAMYDLGVSYEKAAGVRKNTRKAYLLYLAAAIHGDAQAIFEVGRCLQYGIGIGIDRQSAKIWLERAKQLGTYKARQNEQ